MFKSPYETKAARFYDVKEVGTSIKEASVAGELIFPKTLSGTDLMDIKGVTALSESVPSFPHPIEVSLMAGDYTIVDLRPYTRVSKSGEIEITNTGEYNLAIVRAMLQNNWNQDPQELLFGDFPPMIFMKWLGGAITSKLGLNPEEQVMLNMVTGFYYFSLFNEENFSETEKLQIAKRVAKLSFIPLDTAVDIAERLDYMESLDVYIDTLKEMVRSPRIDNLNSGLLLTILGNSWFGFNAKEMTATAIEYPPLFISMVLAALESRSYRKSYLGDLVYRNDKRNMGKDFSKLVYHSIKQ